MKRILLPTDFSPCAETAKKVAFDLAKKIDGEVHIVHSVNTIIDWKKVPAITNQAAVLPSDYTFESHLAEPVEEAMDQVREALDGMVQEARANWIKAESHLVLNKTYEGIIDFAKEWDIDLIVMGTHGAKGLKDTFVGSNTQRVVRYAKCPILTVKEPLENEAIQNVVYASDFDEKDLNTNIAKVRDFASQFNAKLHLLYVNTPNYFEETKYTQRKMEMLAKKYELKDFTINIYNDFVAEDGVLEFAKRCDADVVSITTHGYKGIRRLFNNNVTEQLINASKAPVLCLNLE
jgi:nucleotide-binding universal stress UspA family protein